jgi:hypothetical protein
MGREIVRKIDGIEKIENKQEKRRSYRSRPNYKL